MPLAGHGRPHSSRIAGIRCAGGKAIDIVGLFFIV